MAPRVAVGIVVLTLAAALAGCALNGAGDAAPSATDSVPAIETQASPFEQFMGQAFAGGDSVADMAAKATRVQDIIASCMADQGFEYIPIDTSTMFDGFEDAEQAPARNGYGDREYIAVHGYDISTYAQDDSNIATIAPDDGQYTDPNQAIVDAMSPAEQDSYNEALYGSFLDDSSEYDEDGFPVDGGYSWENAGCQGKAEHEVNPVEQDDQWEELESEIQTMYDDLPLTPDFVALDAKWSECMASAGHSGLTVPDDAWEEIDSKMAALRDDPSFEASIDPDTYLPDPDYPGLKELQSEEVSMALADYDCKRQIGYDDAALAIQYAAEQDFLDSHRSEMEAYRDSFAEELNSSSGATETSTP